MEPKNLYEHAINKLECYLIQVLFHDAESLQKAKLIDLLQELIRTRNVDISTTAITGKWCEIDTEQDLSNC